jgi:hypothetical protein
MQTLPLDIKLIIASTDQTIWYNLYLADQQFRDYHHDPLTAVYITSKFVDLFVEAYTDDNNCKVTVLFGKKNSIRDQPAEVDLSNGHRCWFLHGKLHRDNDLPGIIMPNGDRFWYQNGKIYRKNNLPAIIRLPNQDIWYNETTPHRITDLIAGSGIDGIKWYRPDYKQHLTGGITIIYSDRNVCYYNQNDLQFIVVPADNGMWIIYHLVGW